MTVDVIQSDGSARDIGVVLSDSIRLGYYLGNSPTMTIGDNLMVKRSGNILDGGTYDIIDAGFAEEALTFIQDIAESDEYVDTTKIPWELVIHKKGDTGSELLRKKLKDVDGNNITEVTKVIGQHVDV